MDNLHDNSFSFEDLLMQEAVQKARLKKLSKIK